ncbi:hypothetical protein [Thioalkalivibrio sp. ALR17-21]|uniref:hypothetical protein n=1 Tax=Thioalkalivibrio sp. ALR17-21 TaxID=1269813 RepID=UPI0004074D6B|nr:hypothetical protein [Thioalkalivibrio sp. ALR17-21]
MKMKMMALALVAPMALGLAACSNEGEGPEIDASSEAMLMTSSMQAVTWFKEKGEEVKARELGTGVELYIEEGKAEELDGLRATRAHAEVQEVAEEVVEKRRKEREAREQSP